MSSGPAFQTGLTPGAPAAALPASGGLASQSLTRPATPTLIPAASWEEERVKEHCHTWLIRLAGLPLRLSLCFSLLFSLTLHSTSSQPLSLSLSLSLSLYLSLSISLSLSLSPSPFILPLTLFVAAGLSEAPMTLPFSHIFLMLRVPPTGRSVTGDFGDLMSLLLCRDKEI